MLLAALLFAGLLQSVFGYCVQTIVAAQQGGMYQSQRPGCGLCPPQNSCINLPAIRLGYCCGYRQNRDNVPITCPEKMLCPPPSTLLWNDYNYLMDCCC